MRLTPRSSSARRGEPAPRSDRAVATPSRVHGTGLRDREPSTRREFLQSAGTGLLGALALPTLARSNGFMEPFAPPIPKLGVQLYTVRDQIKQDIKGTLKRVAAMGYEGVETAFWPEGVTPRQAAQHLQDAGLTVCSSHIELPIGDHRGAMLEAARAYGCNRMIWHGWPEDKRYRTLEGTRELVGLYNQANRFAKDNGLEFGLHNHWWEYRNRVGGRFVFEVLLDEVDPDVFFEVDTYWVKVAGHNPADVLRRLGDRARMLHLKDGPARWSEKLAEDNPDPMTAVGKGTQDVPAIAAAARGHAEWMIVEMDKTATDVFDALQRVTTTWCDRGWLLGRSG